MVVQREALTFIRDIDFKCATDWLPDRRYVRRYSLIIATADKHDSEPDEPTWRAVVRRAAIMNRIFDDADAASRLTAEEAAALLGVDRATVYRWRAAYQVDRRTSSLLPSQRGRPKGRRFVFSNVDAIIVQQINEFYLVDAKPGLAELLRRIHASCHAAGLRTH